MSGSAQAQERQGNSATGSWWFQLLKVAVSGTLLWLVVRRFSLEEIRANVLQTQPAALVLPLAILVASNLLAAMQWGWLLRASGIAVSLSRVLGLYFAGLFLNNFLVGSLGGDVYKIIRLGRSEGALGRVAGATVVDRLVGVSALCALALIAAVGALVHGEMPAQLVIVVLGVSLGVLFGAGIVLHARWGATIEQGVRRLPFGGLSERVGRLVGYLREYRDRAEVLNGTFGLSLLIQSARVLAHYFVGLAMGLPLLLTDIGKFFLVVPVLGLLISVPISVGGWGLREWAGVVLFAPLGRRGDEAVALLGITATLTVVASLLGGIALLADGWRRRQTQP